jgi:hypothetical protein
LTARTSRGASKFGRVDRFDLSMAKSLRLASARDHTREMVARKQRAPACRAETDGVAVEHCFCERTLAAWAMAFVFATQKNDAIGRRFGKVQ